MTPLAVTADGRALHSALGVVDTATGAVLSVDPNLLWDPSAWAECDQEAAAYTAARGDNPYGRWVTIDGRRVFIRGTAPLSERRMRALLIHKPHSAEAHRVALEQLRAVAKALGATLIDDNEPLDVQGVAGGRKYGVEVKTFLHNTNDKVTIHPESLRRKLAWARREKAALHTVVVDLRGGGYAVYHRRGVGSFRLSAMNRLGSLRELRDELTAGERRHAVDAEGHEGVWRTIRGRRVFIRTKETPEEALRRSLEKEDQTQAEVRNLSSETQRNAELEALIVSEARRNGLIAGQVILDYGEPPLVTLEGERYRTTGQALLDQNRIVMFMRSNSSPETIVHTVAHEAAHLRYEAVQRAFAKETAAIAKDPRGGVSPSGRPLQGVIDPEDFLRPQYRKDYPVYAKLERFRFGGALQKLMKEDGVTEYSRAWWTAMQRPGGGVTYHHAEHEVIAEIAALRRRGLGDRVPKFWQQYADAIDSAYNLIARKEASK